MTIEDVQDRFRDCFPLLDIVFYRNPYKKGKPSDKNEEFPPHERITYIRDNHYNGVLEIKSWYAVAKVEQELKELFGLNAHIVRKDADNRWMPTTLRADDTLADQAGLYSVAL
jgi:hypothetical protein